MNTGPWRLIFLLVVLGVGIAAGYHFWPERTDSDTTPAVIDVSAWPGNDPDVVFSAPGVVEPVSRALNITSQLTGPIAEITVNSGDTIKRNQVLFKLGNEAEAAQVRHREALLQAAKAQLTKLENWDRKEDRAVAKALWDEAQANAALAAFELERVLRLAKDNAVSDREIANAEQASAAAAARAAAARARYELSEAGAREEDLAVARAAVAEAQAQLAIAEAILDKTIVRSPIDGIVIYRHIEPGEMITPDVPTPVLTIGDTSVIHLRADVDETNLSQVKVGQPVFATAFAFGSERFHGKVVHVEQTLGRKNFRTFKPTEKADTKILEVVIELDDGRKLPVDLQMTVWFRAGPDRAGTPDDAEAEGGSSDKAAGEPGVERTAAAR